MSLAIEPDNLHTDQDSGNPAIHFRHFGAGQTHLAKAFAPSPMHSLERGQNYMRLSKNPRRRLMPSIRPARAYFVGPPGIAPMDGLPSAIGMSLAKSTSGNNALGKYALTSVPLPLAGEAGLSV